jgi:hypothetical protein
MPALLCSYNPHTAVLIPTLLCHPFFLPRSLCPNGTRDHRAVIGAVNLFAMHHSLSVGVTWGEHDKPSWLIRKPSRREEMQAGTAGTARVTAAH